MARKGDRRLALPRPLLQMLDDPPRDGRRRRVEAAAGAVAEKAALDEPDDKGPPGHRGDHLELSGPARCRRGAARGARGEARRPRPSERGIILEQIGFARPAAQDRAEFADDVTKERIPEMEGDRLFYYVYETGDGGGEAQAAEWTDEPLWQALEVVQASRAHPVDDAIWNTAGGVLAANLLLEDIARIYGASIGD
jgi:hypothetical protein